MQSQPRWSCYILIISVTWLILKGDKSLVFLIVINPPITCVLNQKYIYNTTFKFSVTFILNHFFTLFQVIKARVKELMIPRFKIICIVDIGQSNNQALLMGSRCLWDPSNDTYSSAEFRNNSLFAICQVYGVYYE